MDWLVTQILAERRIILARHSTRREADAQAALLRQSSPTAYIEVEAAERLPRGGRTSLRDYIAAYRNA